MDALFENRYLVTDSEGVKYLSADEDVGIPPVRRSGRGGSVVRAVGLGVSILIVVFALLLQESFLILIGFALVAVYLYRIFYFFRKESPAPQQSARLRPVELKWERVIRFGDRIVVDDPRRPMSYSYGQIERMTENAAYLTLWLDDLSTLQISKTGFTVGSCEDFTAYMEHVIKRNSSRKTTGESK